MVHMKNGFFMQPMAKFIHVPLCAIKRIIIKIWFNIFYKNIRKWNIMYYNYQFRKNHHYLRSFNGLLHYATELLVQSLWHRLWLHDTKLLNILWMPLLLPLLSKVFKTKLLNELIIVFASIWYQKIENLKGNKLKLFILQL